MMTSQVKCVALVDEHPIVRIGLRHVLERSGQFCVCGEFSDRYRAGGGILSLRPDLVITELWFSGGSGLDLIRHLRASGLCCPVLVFSHLPEQLYADACLRAGAQGFLSKEMSPEDILSIARKVLSGHLHLGGPTAARILKTAAGKSGTVESVTLTLHRLGERELEILWRIGMGQTSSEISEALHLSPRTLQFYRSRARSKLGLKSSSELIEFAVTLVAAEMSVNRERPTKGKR